MLRLRTIDKVKNKSISTVTPMEAAIQFASEWVKGGTVSRWKEFSYPSIRGMFAIKNDPADSLYEIYWDNRDNCFVVCDVNAE